MSTRVSIATDDFNRASIGANWAQRNGNWGNIYIQASTYIEASGGDVSNAKIPAAQWVGAGSFTNDHYSSIVVSNFNNGGGSLRMGVIARCSTDTDANRDYYAYGCIDDQAGSPANRTFELFKVVNGTVTTLATGTKSVANGDRIEIECIGTTITGLINGVSTGHSVTDSSLTTGGVGVMVSNVGLRGDNWDAGTAAAVVGGILKQSMDGNFQNLTGGLL